MDVDELVDLPQTEAEYAAWVQQHPHGYIVNAPKHGNDNMMWHRASCSYIVPYANQRSVEGDQLKACSTHAGALAVWAKRRSDSEGLEYCQECRDKTKNEQK